MQDTSNRFRVFQLFQADYEHESTLQVAGKAGIGGTVLGFGYGVAQNWWFALPPKKAYPNLVRTSGLGGISFNTICNFYLIIVILLRLPAAFAAIYLGTKCFFAKSSHHEDYPGAAAAGFAVGVATAVSRSPQLLRMFAYGSFGAGGSMALLFAKREYDAHFNPSSHHEDAEKVLSVPVPDPFARRWAELQERDLPGAKTQ
jgi:hypothetical protein